MTVRASVAIRKGEQLFTSYTLPLDGKDLLITAEEFNISNAFVTGTIDRRAVLRQSKVFECDCCRCSDPTECSTYLSAVRCPNCPIGVVLPVHPLEEEETEWRCSQCPYTLTAAVVAQVTDNINEELQTILPNQVDR